MNGYAKTSFPFNWDITCYASQVNGISIGFNTYRKGTQREKIDTQINLSYVAMVIEMEIEIELKIHTEFEIEVEI